MCCSRNDSYHIDASTYRNLTAFHLRNITTYCMRQICIFHAIYPMPQPKEDSTHNLKLLLLILSTLWINTFCIFVDIIKINDNHYGFMQYMLWFEVYVYIHLHIQYMRFIATYQVMATSFSSPQT